MVSKPTFQKKDADKNRAELIEELEALRGYYVRLKAVVDRYERAMHKKDLYHSLYDLEVERDRIEALRAELREERKEIDLQGEELEVQKEEMRAQLEVLQLYEERWSRAEETREGEASLRRFATVVRDSNDAVTLFDRDGRILAWNKGACDSYGYSEEEALAMDILSIVPEGERHNYEAMMDRLWRGETIKSFETKRIAKDGRILDVWLTATSLKGEDRKTYTIATTERDITERNRAAMELRDMNKTLERLVSERTAGLDDAKSQAELYLDLMGHDINNINQAALGYLEMAIDLSGDARDAYMDKAMEALNRTTQLISNVRKLQKLNGNRAPFLEVDVCAVLSEVQAEYAMTPGKQIILNLNGHERCPVPADDLLHDVFSNLVGNAVKHTGDNVRVSIGLDTVREDGRTYCRVAVDDSGQGIPDDFKAMIFHRTLQGTDKARGMGLGLYIVKSLVNSYGGRVWVEDRIEGDPTQGARFVVMLPAVEK